MTFILHFQTSQEKRSTKGLSSFPRVADDTVVRVYDAGLPNPQSAGAMQDGVRLALLHFL
jgi:hypothetical protein